MVHSDWSKWWSHAVVDLKFYYFSSGYPLYVQVWTILGCILISSPPITVLSGAYWTPDLRIYMYPRMQDGILASHELGYFATFLIFYYVFRFIWVYYAFVVTFFAIQVCHWQNVFMRPLVTRHPVLFYRTSTRHCLYFHCTQFCLLTFFLLLSNIGGALMKTNQ